LLIRQTLSSGSTDQIIGALAVTDTKSRASIVAEIELGKVAVQVSLAAMLVDADQAALKPSRQSASMPAAGNFLKARIADDLVSFLIRLAAPEKPTLFFGLVIAPRAQEILAAMSASEFKQRGQGGISVCVPGFATTFAKSLTTLIYTLTPPPTR
jgi:hypothetical protein